MRKLSSYLFILSAAAILSGIAACNKLSKATYTPPVSDTVVVKSNVLVVDSTQYTLISTTAQLNDGIYVYSFKPSITDIRHNGDFAPNTTIIGITGQGYLRKIVSITSTSETITVNTVLGKLEDVFQEANIAFKTGAADEGNPLNYTFNNELLSQNSGTDVRLKSGNFSLTQYWDYAVKIHNGTLASYVKNCKEVDYANSLQFNVGASKASNIHLSDTLKKYVITRTMQMGRVPLLITTETYLIANVDGSGSGLQNHDYAITNSALFNINVTYSNGSWLNTINTSPSASSITGNTSAAPTSAITCNIVPVTNVKFYGEVISSSSYPLNSSLNANLSATTSDWDFSGRSFLQPQINEYTAILSYSASEFNKTWDADSAKYFAPYSIVKASGDNQNGTSGQYLPKPIVARVVDQSGNGVPGVTVHFKVTSGGGYLTYSSIVSDANGLAPATWQYGFGGGTQSVEASAKNASGNNIVNSPAVFTAY